MVEETGFRVEVREFLGVITYQGAQPAKGGAVLAHAGRGGAELPSDEGYRRG